MVAAYPFAALFAAAGLLPEAIAQLAHDTGFCQRQGGKIRPCAWLCHLCAKAAEGTVSYAELAGRLAAATGQCASRQAYAERTTPAGLAFLRQLLALALGAKVARAAAPALPAIPGITRILVQDSTVLRLPLALWAEFSGVGNGAGAVCHARVQVIYDLLQRGFIHFTIDPYTRNDQAAADELVAAAGDLVLRDRGYFNYAQFARLFAAGAHLITRYKHKVCLYDAATGAPLDVHAHLRQHGTLDRPVLVGPQRTPMRLLAAPLPTLVVAQRKRQAKAQAKGHQPSAELLDLLQWGIFLTSLTTVTLHQIFALYGLRWRIECLFKSWKSSGHFAHIHRVGACQLRMLLTARLLLFTLLHHQLWVPLACQVAATTDRHLSMLKVMHYLISNPGQVPRLLATGHAQRAALAALTRYCAYDRRQRPNYEQQLVALLTDLAATGALA